MLFMGMGSSEDRSFPDTILASSSYIPADRDTDFMQREELRPLRLGLELLKERGRAPARIPQVFGAVP